MLKELYEQLTQGRTSHDYTAVPIGNASDAYLGIDTEGKPTLFVVTSGPAIDPSLRTAEISLRLSVALTLTPPSGAPIQGQFNCLSCESTEQSSIETFLVLMDALISSANGEAITDAALSQFFRSAVRLFAVQPTSDLTGTRQGLWGELFLMRSTHGFRFWSPFWHTQPERRFDFSVNGRRLEVKTALEGPRIHHFGHRQIFAPPGEEILIASLLVNIDDAGLTLRELIAEGRTALVDTPDFLKLERAVRRVGMDDPSESGPAYDPLAAAIHIAWYAAVDVPHFRVPEPPGVSDTRYRVDLSTAPPLDSDLVETRISEWFAEQQPV